MMLMLALMLFFCLFHYPIIQFLSISSHHPSCHRSPVHYHSNHHCHGTFIDINPFPHILTSFDVLMAASLTSLMCASASPHFLDIIDVFLAVFSSHHLRQFLDITDVCPRHSLSSLICPLSPWMCVQMSCIRCTHSPPRLLFCYESFLYSDLYLK